MKRIVLSVALALLGCFSLKECSVSYSEYETEKRKNLESQYWDQDSFFFTPTSCKDDTDGADCSIMLTPGIGAALLFPQMGRVYLEGTLGLGEKRKVKVLIAHGTLGKKIPNVPAGHKLISCYCDQPECLIDTPYKPVYVEYNKIFQGFNFSVIKPD